MREILNMEEGQFLEFKSCMVNGGTDKKGQQLPKEVMQHETTEAIAGFLNSEGGVLVIGFFEGSHAAPGKKIVGIEKDFERNSKKPNRDGWMLTLEQIINRDIGVNFGIFISQAEFFEYKEGDVDGVKGSGTVAKITVHKSNKAVYWGKDKEFPVRTKNSTIKLNHEQTSDWISNHDWSASAPEQSHQEYDDDTSNFGFYG